MPLIFWVMTAFALFCAIVAARRESVTLFVITVCLFGLGFVVSDAQWQNGHTANGEAYVALPQYVEAELARQVRITHTLYLLPLIGYFIGGSYRWRKTRSQR